MWNLLSKGGFGSVIDGFVNYVMIYQLNFLIIQM